MIEQTDEFGLPVSRPPRSVQRARSASPYRRMRGAWPEAIENMRINDSKTVSVHFSHAEYTPEKAKEALAKEGRAIKKAMNRVRNQRPEYRLRQFKITRTDTPDAQMCRVVSTTLTRIA
jgi:hypothetical protein